MSANITTRTIEERLMNLSQLQKVHSEIDKIKILLGELPLEVQDLEDSITGLETRVSKHEEAIAEQKRRIAIQEDQIVDSEAAIAKYKEQQNNIRNNREFESLEKEIEYKNLEIQLAKKKAREAKIEIDNKQALVDEANRELEKFNQELDQKLKEMKDISAETNEREAVLLNEVALLEKNIEPRLLGAYHRIRGGARNGLAVVPIQRGACGGCFNLIPPQRKIEVANYKKIIVCEYCGRILIGSDDESLIEQE